MGIYSVQIKRMQQLDNGKYRWMFKIRSNGDSCNAISNYSFTDDEVKRYVENLVADLLKEKQ